jgi:hypothetical protein
VAELSIVVRCDTDAISGRSSEGAAQMIVFWRPLQINTTDGSQIPSERLRSRSGETGDRCGVTV